jgi:hypothetical protein
MDYQKRMVEEAKNNLLARFPFYAASLQQQQQQQVQSSSTFDFNPDDIPFPPTGENVPQMVPPPEEFTS